MAALEPPAVADALKRAGVASSSFAGDPSMATIPSAMAPHAPTTPAGARLASAFACAAARLFIAIAGAAVVLDKLSRMVISGQHLFVVASKTEESGRLTQQLHTHGDRVCTAPR